jgi:hypothetical protein
VALGVGEDAEGDAGHLLGWTMLPPSCSARVSVVALVLWPFTRWTERPSTGRSHKPGLCIMIAPSAKTVVPVM